MSYCPASNANCKCRDNEPNCKECYWGIPFYKFCLSKQVECDNHDNCMNCKYEKRCV